MVANSVIQMEKQMPALLFSLLEHEKSITRPIAIDVIRQLISQMAITEEYRLQYPTDLGAIIQPGSALNDTTVAVTSNATVIEVEVQDDFVKETIASGYTHESDAPPVFEDEVIGLVVRPIYATSLMTIGFKYTANSRNQITKWRNFMRARASKIHFDNLHNVTYHIPLPSELLNMVQEIHELRERTAGYGDEFGEYYFSHCAPETTVLTDLSGKASVIAVPQTQVGVIGYFDISVIPDKEEGDSDTSRWTASFNYNLRYERPSNISAIVPVMVHNTTIPDKYLLERQPWNVPEPLRKKTLSRIDFDTHSRLNKNKITSSVQRVLNIPEYDFVTLGGMFKEYFGFMTVLCSLNTKDYKELFNVNELGDYTVDSYILDFLKTSEYPYITKHHQSIFQVFRCEQQRYVYNDLTCDTNLNIRSMNDLNPRNINRLVFALIIDFSALTKDAINRLIAHPDVLARIIGYINHELSLYPRNGYNKITPQQLINAGFPPNIVKDFIETYFPNGVNSPTVFNPLVPITVMNAIRDVQPLIQSK